MQEFQSWIDDSGGIHKVAKKLGTTRTAVWGWYHRRGWPKVDTIVKILKLSNGRLTFEKIVDSTKPQSK